MRPRPVLDRAPSWCQRPVFAVLVTVGAMATLAALPCGQSSFAANGGTTSTAASSYSPTSPHWPHINVCDLGRKVRALDPADGTLRTAYEWYARHVDVIEVGMNTFFYHFSPQPPAANVKTYNPAIKTVGYDIDLTICQHDGCYSAMPAAAAECLPSSEDQYLHFSENTTLDYYSLQNEWIGSASIPGCPDADSLSAASRVQVFMWRDYRWLPNLKSPAWRDWYARHLLREMNEDSCNAPYPVDGLFLDEHRGRFSLGMDIGFQTRITSGGGILEYGGLRPRDYTRAPGAGDDDLDIAYNADAVIWLTELRGRLGAAGKFVHINTAEYFMDSFGFAQSLAAKGAMTELLHAPDHFRTGAAMYRRFIEQVRRITAIGGTIDLAYAPCVPAPDGYGAGNYSTASERYRMWRLASYYVVREFPGDSGRAYFNPSLCVDPSAANPLDFVNEWLPAYEVDVGQPLDTATVVQQGPLACSAQGYAVFGRQYTKALVLVRPRDDYACTDYGDATAVTVALPQKMVMLKADGAFSRAMDSVSIRNGEAVVLFRYGDVVPPDGVRDLRIGR